LWRLISPIFECRSGNLRPQRLSQRIFRAEFIWSKPSPVASKVPPNSPTNNSLNVSDWSLLQLMNLLFTLGYLFVQAVLGTMKDPSITSSRRESAGRACTDALRTLPGAPTKRGARPESGHSSGTNVTPRVSSRLDGGYSFQEPSIMQLTHTVVSKTGDQGGEGWLLDEGPL
jgi:hypothetical protein